MWLLYAHMLVDYSSCVMTTTDIKSKKVVTLDECQFFGTDLIDICFKYVLNWRAGSLLWHELKSLKMIRTSFLIKTRSVSVAQQIGCQYISCVHRIYSRHDREKEMKWNICHCRRKIKARIYYSFFF